MKCKIPEISWHNRDPVLTVDIQLRGKISDNSVFCRLASGGADSHVIVWFMKYSEENKSEVQIEYAADLARHQRAVNAVRWSPDGKYLASADDESAIIVWKRKGEHEHTLDDLNEGEKEVWLVHKILRGHTEDIYDINWSPDSLHLVSGSVDNSAIVWDVHKGRSLTYLRDHKGYVQGVAWDPKNNYIATLSTDRHLRIFDVSTKKLLHRISKAELPVPDDHEMSGKIVRLFHDGTLQTYFRRLAFTPDGSLLLTPAGLTDYDGPLRPMNVTYGFSRIDFKRPAYTICSDQYSAVVSCSPLLYKLRPHDPAVNSPMIDLPYRMVYAVANKNSVHFYDTQQDFPIAVIANIHYTRLTDLSWSGDGQVVVVSSTDGFCSLITFAEGELGELYDDMENVLNAEISPAAVASTPSRKKKKRKSKITNELSNNNIEDISEVKLATVNSNYEKSRPVAANQIDVKRKTEHKETKNTPVANHIAVKKKPSLNEVNTKIESSQQPALEKAKLPCAIEQKAVETEVQSENIFNLKNQLQTAVVANVICDKNILSSNEKFDMPTRKKDPSTPITVRRQPRHPRAGPKTPVTPVTAAPVVKRQPSKTPNRIEVRRTPRTILATAVSVKNFTPNDEEIANEPWIKEDGVRPFSPEKKAQTLIPTVVPKSITIEDDSIIETQNLKLVFEITNDEASSQLKDSSVKAAAHVDAAEAKPEVSIVPKVTQDKKTPRRTTPRSSSKRKRNEN